MRRLTVTFDNGPHPEVTPRVLDLLRERGIQAHFFVVGARVAKADGRRLVSRAVAEGHLVGNHSFSHAVPLGEDPRPDAVEAEIVATERLLDPLVGGARRFRPSGRGGRLGRHLLTRSAVAYLTSQRYSCVLWNSVPGDWKDPEGWPERALADCAAREHTLLVLHDVPDACAAKLGGFLDRARALGVAFVSDLPPECTPIVDGAVVGDLGALLAA